MYGVWSDLPQWNLEHQIKDDLSNTFWNSYTLKIGDSVTVFRELLFEEINESLEIVC